MAALTCPHCAVLTNFTEVWYGEVPRGSRDYDGSSYAIAQRCQNPACGRVLGGVRSSADQANLRDWWPRKTGGKQFPDVPNEIAVVANEAHLCVSIGAYHAAMALARAVVEATAKHQGVAARTLEQKIDGLSVRDDAKKAAHAIRLVGNDAAHGDLAAMVIDEDDANDLLDLMDDILDEVFQSPATTARVIANRLARIATIPTQS